MTTVMVTFVHAKLVLSFFSRNWTTGFEISLYTLVKIKTRWQLPLSQQNLSKNICLDDNCQEYCINIRYFLPNFKQILFVSRKIYPAILSWWQLSPEVLSESRLGHFFDTDNKTKTILSCFGVKAHCVVLLLYHSCFYNCQILS